MKVEKKHQLYYNKYTYKAAVKTPGVSFLHKRVKSVTELKKRVDGIHSSNARRYYPWLNEVDYDLIEKLLAYLKDFASRDLGTVRKDAGNLITFYSDDISELKKLADITDLVEFSQAMPSPDGIKYFAKDPPAKYRLYLSGNKFDISIKAEIVAYLAANIGVNASSALYSWLNSAHYFRNSGHIWTYTTHYIDCNDDKLITMIHLKFPGLLGKIYKLEKRPD